MPPLRERPAHRHPHQQRGRAPASDVQRRSATAPCSTDAVHRRRPVREHDHGVEDHAGRHRAGTASARCARRTDPSPTTRRASHVGRGQQEQRRHHQGEQQVLDHVGGVEVLLADVVHRPVGRPPTAATTPATNQRRWRRVIAGVPAGTTFGPDDPGRVDVQADERRRRAATPRGAACQRQTSTDSGDGERRHRPQPRSRGQPSGPDVERRRARSMYTTTARNEPGEEDPA